MLFRIGLDFRSGSFPDFDSEVCARSRGKRGQIFKQATLLLTQLNSRMDSNLQRRKPAISEFASLLGLWGLLMLVKIRFES